MATPQLEDLNLQKRVDELELRFMEQQRLLEDLSSVIYAQQRTVDLAFSRLDQLEKKLAGEPGLVDARADERPPHY
ncbi:MAG: SlyX family protein [Myxococcota bacterium]|nr:SlyX family protein [Myxococcota bacterium]